jgi:hypothetical protein
MRYIKEAHQAYRRLLIKSSALDLTLPFIGAAFLQKSISLKDPSKYLYEIEG